MNLSRQADVHICRSCLKELSSGPTSRRMWTCAPTLEIGSRRILHYNVTAHPTAAWTVQQFREAIPSDHSYQFLIHDRDSIFSRELDQQLKNDFNLKVLRTPVRAPKANAYCERLVGTVRRECLDFMIPLSERHLRMTLRSWVTHYNKGRPHSSLGPEVPENFSVGAPHDPGFAATNCHGTVRSERWTSSAVYITNTGWNSAWLEPSKVFADDTGTTESPSLKKIFTCSRKRSDVLVCPVG